ncbi:MAG: AhpC/TSA family protein [Prevotellaceae bacterium]|jgi:peroxiredoxin|nr:AhpC/TSA family protein [Prevotellaceae bacterium]
MKKTGLFFTALTAALLSACSSQPGFEVEGEVADADGKMLYLEASAMRGILPLDSVRLKSSGSYRFRQPRPQSPEFYRLRIEGKVINFSADSTETIRIDAPYAHFSTAYTVEGSPNSAQIKELTLKQMKLQAEVDHLTAQVHAHRLGMDLFEDSIGRLFKNYRSEVAHRYIYPNPTTAAAYFALFQKVNNYLIFDPLNNREDNRVFAAVATSLNQQYPHADRSKNLYNIVIKGMKNTRTPSAQPVSPALEGKISETGIIDLALRDAKGDVRRLSDLKGKVVLLDFTVYQNAVSTPHNFLLNELYDKYKARGLEIYQVSLDADEHFWRTTASNLPWICVRDPRGIYSSSTTLYNIESLPAFFLINRKSELSARGETVKDLDAALRRLL